MTDEPKVPDFAELVDAFETATALYMRAPERLSARAEANLIAARSALLARYEAMRNENGRLRRTISSCQWYWPKDDTSSEMCADNPFDIYHEENPGTVVEISRGGVVEVRHYAWLPPASDAGSDDDFEVDEPTAELAQTKIDAELARRTALSQAKPEER